ncbi:WAP four-disulfide core domain protein 2-like [Schistocerca serialis cubense]|uniref:WAP four-disulfide core domain protein 2-like n=1 Tax=Schistocerca serialis cubense TaxID=2023355 RepID=UPI00214F445E|nr:WAP four-disulfide core domain protein 2-like [Schistocerca serialis cubense]
MPTAASPSKKSREEFAGSDCSETIEPAGEGALDEASAVWKERHAGPTAEAAQVLRGGGGRRRSVSAMSPSRLPLALLLLLPLLLAPLAAGAYEKPGACSPALPQLVCERTCAYDGHCPGQLKCCATTCGGAVCSQPVTRSRAPLIMKAGTCPDPPPRKPWVCSNRCSLDGDCRGPLKCCRSACGGLACLPPAYPEEPLLYY